jgi:DNA-binding transcriptional regulator YdaS (Cro superfamily)
MSQHPIDVAAGIVGSQAALAVALGVTRAAVTQWKEVGRKTPAEHCPKIERLTGGKVTCEQLRDDIEWHVLRADPQSTDPAPAAVGQGA